MQEEAGIVRFAGEIGRGGHVAAGDAQNLAERAAVEHVAGDPVAGRIALHEADDHRLSGPLRGRRDLARAGRIRRRRFFHEDRQALVEGRDGGGAVQVGADRHADGVEARLVDQRAEIVMQSADAVVRRRLRQGCAVPVAQGGDAEAVAPELRQQHLPRVAAAADPADIDHWSTSASASALRMRPRPALSLSLSSSRGARQWAMGSATRSSSRRKGSSEIGPP